MAHALCAMPKLMLAPVPIPCSTVLPRRVILSYSRAVLRRAAAGQIPPRTPKT